MQSESSEQVQSVADTRGKHRILAELKRLEQETRFLEVKLCKSDHRPFLLQNPQCIWRFGKIGREELEQLEKMEKASTFCKEMLNNVETRPDPLLPITNGPVNPLWDRWFEGPRENSGCRCWIL